MCYPFVTGIGIESSGRSGCSQKKPERSTNVAGSIMSSRLWANALWGVHQRRSLVENPRTSSNGRRTPSPATKGRRQTSRTCSSVGSRLCGAWRWPGLRHARIVTAGTRRESRKGRSARDVNGDSAWPSGAWGRRSGDRFAPVGTNNRMATGPHRGNQPHAAQPGRSSGRFAARWP